MKLYDILFEDHVRGDMYGEFLTNNPEKIRELLQTKLGITDKKRLDSIESKVMRFIQDAKFSQSFNQIFAVVAGVKPMWFGAKGLPNLLGKTFLSALQNSGLKVATVNKHSFVGQPANVDVAAKQLEDHGGVVPFRDPEFHRVLGLALGYPEEDVEEFIRNR